MLPTDVIVIIAAVATFWAFIKVFEVRLDDYLQVPVSSVRKSQNTNIEYFNDDCMCPNCKTQTVMMAPRQADVIQHHHCIACDKAFIAPHRERQLYRRPMATRILQLPHIKDAA